MKKLLYALIFIILDQFTKYLFTNKQYFSGFFQINYAQNTGAAFSILQGYSWLFIIISLGVVFFIFKYYKTIPVKLPLILILSGTIGNLIDRLFLGYVRDFIAISIWPVFNFADVFSCIGIFWLIYIFYTEEKTYKAQNHHKR